MKKLYGLLALLIAILSLGAIGVLVNHSVQNAGTGAVGSLTRRGWHNELFRPGYGTITAKPNRKDIGNGVKIDTTGRYHAVWYDLDAIGHDGDVYYAYFDGSKWRGLTNAVGPDQVSDTTVEAVSPTLTLDSMNRPIISWVEPGYPDWPLKLVHWNGSAWTGYASATPDHLNPNGGIASGAYVSVDSDDRPHVAWGDWGYGSSVDVFYSYFDGTKFRGNKARTTAERYDQVTNDLPDNTLGGMELDSNNRPYFIWHQPAGSNFHVYLTHWNGTTYAGLQGTSPDQISTENGLNLVGKLALDSQNRPIVYWDYALEYPNTDVRGSRWNGTTYSGYKTSNGPDQVTKTTSQSGIYGLAVDSLDRPYLLIGEVGPTEEVTSVHRWDGSNYVGIDTNGPTRVVAPPEGYVGGSLVLGPNDWPIIGFSWNAYSGTDDGFFFTRWQQ